MLTCGFGRNAVAKSILHGRLLVNWFQGTHARTLCFCGRLLHLLPSDAARRT